MLMALLGDRGRTSPFLLAFPINAVRKYGRCLVATLSRKQT